MYVCIYIYIYIYIYTHILGLMGQDITQWICPMDFIAGFVPWNFIGIVQWISITLVMSKGFPRYLSNSVTMDLYNGFHWNCPMDFHHSCDFLAGSVSRGARDRSLEIGTSEIIADFQWHVPMDVQWHFPMDCHFPSGVSLELSSGLSVTFSSGISFLRSLVCNLVPRLLQSISCRRPRAIFAAARLMVCC